MPSVQSDTATDELSTVVTQAKTGDEAAFTTLYRTIQPGLLRYLKALVGEDADDVAAETWLHIARDLGSFTGTGDGFRGWTATVGRHRALDHLRRQQRRPRPAPLTPEHTDVPSISDTAEDALSALSTDDAVTLIAQLPRDQAEAVLLRAVMGLDAETAGRVLGKRAGAVRTAAYRGLRRLAKQLQRGVTP